MNSLKKAAPGYTIFVLARIAISAAPYFLRFQGQNVKLEGSLLFHHRDTRDKDWQRGTASGSVESEKDIKYYTLSFTTKYTTGSSPLILVLAF